jgi:SAM-dependent methyltransferase
LPLPSWLRLFACLARRSSSAIGHPKETDFFNPTAASARMPVRARSSKETAMKGRVQKTRTTALCDWSSVGIEDLLDEIRQLELRATFVRDLTEDAAACAAIERGMRVLDLGCGNGDTSLLIARLVGPSGLVVGVDPSAEAIDVAERRATVSGQCYWTRFVSADPHGFVPAKPFDALVLRLVGRDTRKHAAAFGRLSAQVRRRGVIALVSAAATPTESNRAPMAGAVRFSVPALGR